MSQLDAKQKLKDQENRDDKAMAHSQSRGLGTVKTDPNNIPGRFGDSPSGKDSVDTIAYINRGQNNPYLPKATQMKANRMRHLK